MSRTYEVHFTLYEHGDYFKIESGFRHRVEEFVSKKEAVFFAKRVKKLESGMYRPNPEGTLEFMSNYDIDGIVWRLDKVLVVDRKELEGLF